jgi:hypothetical protein
MALSDSEWKERVLCSDGNCIGVVGPDGRCKVCGLPYDGQLPMISDDDDLEEDGSDGVQTDSRDLEFKQAPTEPPLLETNEKNDDWENRTLCIDESCIGVVGLDGKCKECGKPYPGKTP